MTLRFVVRSRVFIPMASLLDGCHSGALEAAALGLDAGVTLPVAALVAGCRTPSGSEVSERGERR